VNSNLAARVVTKDAARLRTMPIPSLPAVPPEFSWEYDRSEIVVDAVVHAAGLFLGLLGAAALAFEAARLPGFQAAAIAIYAAGLLCMLGLSAAYNLWPVSPIKWMLRRYDHAAIYVLIAGTYTALVACMTKLDTAGALLALIWATAALGIGVKLLLPGRFDRVSIAIYLGLSWSGVGAYEEVIAPLAAPVTYLLLAGGMAYSGGVVFHLWKGLRFQNAIWHLFVLIGAALHYLAISQALT
jgi:hemolysin III